MSWRTPWSAPKRKRSRSPAPSAGGDPFTEEDFFDQDELDLQQPTAATAGQAANNIPGLPMTGEVAGGGVGTQSTEKTTGYEPNLSHPDYQRFLLWQQHEARRVIREAQYDPYANTPSAGPAGFYPPSP